MVRAVNPFSLSGKDPQACMSFSGMCAAVNVLPAYRKFSSDINQEVRFPSIAVLSVPVTPRAEFAFVWHLISGGSRCRGTQPVQNMGGEKDKAKNQNHNCARSQIEPVTGKNGGDGGEAANQPAGPNERTW